MRQIDTREGARRRHRVIALFAVIQCWIKGLDGIVFQRHQRESLLGMQRFRQPRINWLREDLREFFPYQESFWVPKQTKSLASVFVSRFPLRPHLPTGTMSNEERIEGMGEGGPKLAVFETWKRPDLDEIYKLFEGPLPFLADFSNYDERVISSYIALIAQGQVSPRSMLPKKPKLK